MIMTLIVFFAMLVAFTVGLFTGAMWIMQRMAECATRKTIAFSDRDRDYWVVTKEPPY